MLTIDNKKVVNLTNSKSEQSAMTSIHNSVEKKLNPQSTYIEGLEQSQIRSSSLKKDHKKVSYRAKQNDLLWSADKRNSRSSTPLKKTNQNNNLSQSKTLQVNHKKQQKSTTKNKTLIQSLLSSQKKSKCPHHNHHYQSLFQLQHNNKYPFKPQISSQLPKQIYPQQFLQDKISKQQRFERLIQNLRKKHVQRLEQKLNKEKIILQHQCNFQPNKNKQNKKQQTTNQHRNNNIQLLIHEKLFEQSVQIRNQQIKNEQLKINSHQQQIRKLQQQQQQRYQHSKQKLQKLIKNNNKKSQKLQQSLIPIYDRVNKVHQKKKLMINQLRQKFYSQSLIPNQYSINKNKKLNKQQSQHLVKRLVDDFLIEKAQQQLTIQQIKNKQIQTQCPFTPILQITDLHRQKIPKNKNQSIHNLSQQKNKYTFIPKINDTSKVIVQNLTYQNRQGYIDIGQRLCYTNYDHNKVKKLQKIKAQIDHQCTFTPLINKISKQLYYNKGQQCIAKPPPHQCPLPESIIEQRNQQTFHPQINPKSKCLTQKEKILFLQRKSQKSKQKLNKIFHHLQYKQVQQCTFNPKTISTTEEWKKWKNQNLKINKMVIKQNTKDQTFAYNKIQSNNTKQNQSTVMIKGLQSFMRNCENVKRKKIDHQQRLNKIFNFQQKYNQRIQRQRVRE